MSEQKQYTRDELLAICKKASVKQENWLDRDTAAAQRQLGEAYMLLQAGCEVRTLYGDYVRRFTGSSTIVVKSDLTTTDETIWIQITYKGFQYFEAGEFESDTFYLPTREYLRRRKGKDWYL